MEILEFLKEQLLKTQEDLKKFYIQRGKASIETVGSYDIMIERKTEEIEKLEQDIKAIENKSDSVTTTSKSVKNPKEHIETLIEKGKIKEAIEEMKTFSKENGLILLAGRYNRVVQQNNLNTISQTDYNIEMNRITNSLLSMLND